MFAPEYVEADVGLELSAAAAGTVNAAVVPAVSARTKMSLAAFMIAFLF
jgi:hypothetical protein